MKYEIDAKIFEIAPDACFGIVAATGIGPAKDPAAIEAMLAKAVAEAEARWSGKKVKESPLVTPYRDMMRTAGINPNKFMCSLESLLTRIGKGKGMPRISPLVDAYNAISITYDLPLGGHDVACINDRTLTVRPARSGDTFVPFGATEAEAESPDEGEIIYASGNRVHTRRFLWRQSEIGKITPETTEILFPLDGFQHRRQDIIAARDLLAKILREQFGATVEVGIVDKDNPQFATETFA